VNNPHESVAQGDTQVQYAQWWGDSFSNLLHEDCLWAEAICNSHVWEEWGLIRATRDVPFIHLLGMGAWDWRDEGVSWNNSELQSFHHALAIGARLMLLTIEEEEKVLSTFVFFFLKTDRSSSMIISRGISGDQLPT